MCSCGAQRADNFKTSAQTSQLSKVCNQLSLILCLLTLCSVTMQVCQIYPERKCDKCGDGNEWLCTQRNEVTSGNQR